MSEHTQPLVEAFKAAGVLMDRAEGDDGPVHQWLAEECEELRNGIIRILHEIDPEAYYECVNHYIDEVPPPAETSGGR